MHLNKAWRFQARQVVSQHADLLNYHGAASGSSKPRRPEEEPHFDRGCEGRGEQPWSLAS